MFKRHYRKLFSVTVVGALSLVACSGSDQTDGLENSPVRLGDQSWESIWISNAIVGNILEHGYGRSTEIITTSIPVMQQALVQGDIDVNIEIWPQNIAQWWDAVRADGSVVDLDLIMDETRRGFYVPRYVIEGDVSRGIEPVAPDLRTFEQLGNYPELFEDPEDRGRGQIISCIIGWSCVDAAQVKADAYNVADTFNLFQPGSSTAMDAAIVAAYRRGEPVVFYYWEPTWLVSEYDLVLLEMDPWTEACEAATQASVAQGTPAPAAARCDFPTPSVSKAANADFANRNSNIIEFLEAMYLGADRVGELASYMNANDVDASATAKYYLQTYPDEWRSWLPEDVADKVAAALED